MNQITQLRSLPHKITTEVKLMRGAKGKGFFNYGLLHGTKDLDMHQGLKDDKNN